MLDRRVACLDRRLAKADALLGVLTTADEKAVTAAVQATARLDTVEQCADIEALLSSSQQRVSGTVTITLRPGCLFVNGVASPYSLLAATKGVYGEAAGEWTPGDALGYARILSLPGSLQTRAGKGAQ